MDLKYIEHAKDLVEIKDESNPYDFENIFKLDSFEERRLSKRKLKILKAIDPTVIKMLKDGENVYYMTDGIRTSSLENLFIGWVAYYYNYMAFVFTSERVILIHLKSKRKKGAYVGEIKYTDIKSIHSSFLGNFTLKFYNNKNVLFRKVPRKDRKFLKEFLNPILGQAESNADTAIPGIRNLCPRCFTHLTDYPSLCPNCSCKLKSPVVAGCLSLILPGMGDIYLGSKILGFIELIIMIIIWAGFIVGIIEEYQMGYNIYESLIPFIVIMFVVHGTDALKSRYLARKGVFPNEKINYDAGS